MADLALLLPDARDTADNRSALCWLDWLRDEGVDTRVVTWLGGDLRPELAAVAPTVEASAVNRGAVARTLSRARLAPAARVVKNRRLRALLEDAATAPLVLASGTGSTVALDWLPPGRRRVVLQLRPGDDAGHLAAARADAVVAADEVPFLARPAPEAVDRPGVAVAGLAPGAVADLVDAARAVRRARLTTEVHWLRRDGDERWSWALFGDARNVDLAGAVHTVRPEGVAGVDAVLVAGRADPIPALAAGLAGVPVVSVGGAGAAVGEVVADLDGAAARVAELVDGATAEPVDPSHDVAVGGARLLEIVRG